MRAALAAVLAALALAASACEFSQYDSDVASCTGSDGKVEIHVAVYRDSDQSRGDVVPAAYLAACRIIQRAFPEGTR